MNRTTMYGIAFLVAFVTVIALAPASSAEECRSFPVDGCEEISETTSEEETEPPAVATSSKVCWYVVVVPHQVGPVEVAVYQCDPDVTVHEDWDPREDPIYRDWYGNNVTLQDVQDELTQPLEHCWSLGVEVGNYKADLNPCTDRVSTDEDDPDNVVVYVGYAEYELVDGPL